MRRHASVGESNRTRDLKSPDGLLRPAPTSSRRDHPDVEPALGSVPAMPFPVRLLRPLVAHVDRRHFLRRAQRYVPSANLRRLARRFLNELSDPARESVTGGPPFGPGLQDYAEEIAVEIVVEACRRSVPTAGEVRFEARLYEWLVGLLRAEAARIRAVAADPEMIVADRPADLGRHEADDTGRRELIVQHRASGLRAQFTYGGRRYGKTGVVLAKAYSIESIDPERVETDGGWGRDWDLYAGLGIGRAIYRRAATELPNMRWRDNAVSFYGHGIRAAMHAEEPWRWESTHCACSSEWSSLTAQEARRAEHRRTN